MGRAQNGGILEKKSIGTRLGPHNHLSEVLPHRMVFKVHVIWKQPLHIGTVFFTKREVDGASPRCIQRPRALELQVFFPREEGSGSIIVHSGHIEECRNGSDYGNLRVGHGGEHKMTPIKLLQVGTSARMFAISSANTSHPSFSSQSVVDTKKKIPVAVNAAYALEGECGPKSHPQDSVVDQRVYLTTYSVANV